jgi:Spy/CpxP family protein refolding chaperone
MNEALKWKLITGFLLVFLAGGMTGAFFGAHHFRHSLLDGPHREMMGERMRERLRIELKLTPEQVAKITPISDKAAAQLEKIRRETGHRVHDTFVEAHRDMSAALTDEQRAKLQRIEMRHHQFRERHEHRRPPPPTSPEETPRP